jgi:hypothetical protein
MISLVFRKDFSVAWMENELLLEQREGNQAKRDATR